MGFFDFLCDIGSAIVETTVRAVGWVVDKVDDAVTWVSDKLGGSGPYSGTSVQETVDVEKELSKFRESINGQAMDVEEKSISEIMSQFNAFIRELEAHYPSLVAAVKKEQRNVTSSLKGAIVDYARKHISENDPDFRKVLEMKPGSEKKTKLREETDRILRDAQASFDRKLSKAIKGLNEELSERLENELAAKERQLKEETSQYKELERQAQSGAIDLEELEGEYTLLSETSHCLHTLLHGGDQR